MFGWGRQKRQRPADLTAAASQRPEAELGRGLEGQQAGSSSSSKRRRAADLSNGAAAPVVPPPPPAECQSGAFGARAYDNPLFLDGEEDSEDEFEGCGMLSPDWGGSAWSEDTKESGPAVGAAADCCSSQGEFDDFTCTPPGTSGDLLDGFVAALHSTPALCALTALEKLDAHPVGADEFSSLECTCAGMLVLCRRAGLTADECTADCLALTLLWLLQSTGSQYVAGLDYNLTLFLHMHPDRRSLLEGKEMKAAMVQLQLQLLQRCGWRVVLRDAEEVRGALQELNTHPSFAPLCQFISECARTSAVPLGTHGHSPAAAAAAAAAQQQAAAAQQRSACSHASAQSCASGSRSAVGPARGALRPSNRR